MPSSLQAAHAVECLVKPEAAPGVGYRDAEKHSRVVSPCLPDQRKGARMTERDLILKRRRWQLIILVALYAGYGSFMLCRNTLNAVSVAMIDDPLIAMDKAAYGQIISYNSLGAMAGKIVTGVGADIIGGRLMFLLALGLTAVTTAGFGLVSSFGLLAACNFFGQFFKAGGWPAMAKLIGNWYEPGKHGTVWSLLSTSSRAGTIAAGLVLGYFLKYFHWRTIFFIAAGLTLVVVTVIAFVLRERPEDVDLPPTSAADAACSSEPLPQHRFDHLGTLQALGAFCKSARFWLIGLGLAFLTMMMDIIYLLPVYFGESLGLPAGEAAMAGSAFPAGSFLALLAAGPIYDALSKRGHVFFLGGTLVVAVGCVVGIQNLPAGTGHWTVMSLLFLFGVVVSPAYYIPMSVFSISFGGKHSGFLVALLDVFGYAGAFLFNFYSGTIAQEYGWGVFFSVLLGITVVAAISTTAFLVLEDRASRR